MIKVKADKIAELTTTYGFESANHPQLGVIYGKDGIFFTSKGQFVGLAMPLPLPTAKVISELVVADILIEDTGLVLDPSQAQPQESPQKVVEKKSPLIIPR